MSANISKNQKTGEASVFVTGSPAWHGLGTVLDKPATAREAIELAGLDFDVTTTPLFFSTEKRKDPVEIKGKFATIRTDTDEYLGVVGSNYTPVQNRDVFSFFDELVSQNSAIYHTAGVLGIGERIWVLAKLPEYITLPGNDVIEQYVLLYNSHDGKSSVTAMMTPIRVVCNNTLNAALDAKTPYRVNIIHTVNAVVKLKEAHRILGISKDYNKLAKQIYSLMAKKNVNDEDISNFLTFMHPANEEVKFKTTADKYREKITEVMETGIGQDINRGTAWWMYNGYTNFLDHHKEYNNENNKFKSLMWGSSSRSRQKALDYCLELIS